MMNFGNGMAVLVSIAAFAVGGCELGVDDTTRMARAEQAMADSEYRAAAIELKNVLRSDPANVEARVMLGKVSLMAGDISAAAKELQRARELGAEPWEYLVPLASALLRLGNSDDVLNFDAADLTDAGDRADLEAVQGNAYLRKGDIKLAEQKFRLALSGKPGHADSLVGMARVYLEEGNLEAAEDSLQKVISQHPDAHAAYSALGRLQFDSAEYADAESSLRLAIANSDSPGLLNERMNYLAGLVDVLLAQKKVGEAQSVAAQMLEVDPKHPYALFQAARVDFESGQMDATMEKTQRVITAFPDYQPARLLLAAAAMSKENFGLAELHLRSLVSANPDNATARQLLAQAQMSMGVPEEAFNALEPLLQSETTNPRLLAMAGSASLRSGDKEKGMEYLTRGLEAGASDPAVQLQAAASFLAAGELDRAIDLLEQMPQSMHGEKRDFLLILARLRTGDIAGARAQATSLMEQKPDDPASHRIMGSFHTAVGEYELARAQFEKVRELDPTDIGSVINLARLDILNDDLAGAERRYQGLLSQDPGSLVGMLALAQLAEKGGDQERAIELLEKARVANPDAVEPSVLLARYYLRTGSSDLAMERAGQAVEVAPNNVDALNILGQVQFQGNRHSEALGTFERALQHEPNRTETHYYLGQVQLKLGMNEAGRRSMEKTLELNPTHLGSRVALSRMESLAGNFDAALEFAEGLRDEYPDRAEPHALVGDIQIVRGDYNAAIAAYDKSAELLPSAAMTLKRFQARQRSGRAGAYKVLEDWLKSNTADQAIRVNLAQAYQNDGQVDKAVAAYQRVLQSEPENVVAQNNLAWLYSELGGAENLRKGVEIAAKAHRNLPDVGQVTDTYGWLLLKQGKIDQATDKLRLAISQAPDDPDIRYHLAVALQRSGGSAEARDLLDAILSDGSSFSSREDAKALREQLQR